MVRVVVKCPICSEEVVVEAEVRRDFEEFCVVHNEHVFKLYLDREGFPRRVSPVAAARVVGEVEELAVFIGGGKAVVISRGEVVIFDAEEIGVAIEMAEKLTNKNKYIKSQ
ncbi:MAG: hypothetical protein ACPL3C_07350 [Pyrobaculum sp.]|uniref:hypothetical protein n=1 Tax=Pyrobaculum sp. TaxID=2004705 RepID=UPI003C91E6C0